MKVCVKSPPGHPALTAEKEYLVLGLNQASFRVLDDGGYPALFLREFFTVTDDNIPDDWIWVRYSDEEFSANPPETSFLGFYEDYFDHKEDAIRQFSAYLRRIGLEHSNNTK